MFFGTVLISVVVVIAFRCNNAIISWPFVLFMQLKSTAPVLFFYQSFDYTTNLSFGMKYQREK